MNEERGRRALEIFDEVAGLPASERAALLDRACAGDPELRAEIEGLLAADASAPTFLDRSAAEFAGPALEGSLEQERSGERAGPYRLIREIGHGGMSVVYLAERADGQFTRQVAVKLLRHPGGDKSERESRFRAEQEILATLRHPNIASVVDGGVSESGWPYLVMELVEGEPITTYCDRRDLLVEQRLLVFEDVCRAVQHAHQRLVVHRDLKPSNILVQESGEPKLLDFGIAKLLAEDERTVETRTGLLLMTPDYAAPEQARGEAITTATDIYALGLLLYELLTGERAQRVQGGSAAELERVICEREPPRSSVLRGDLETIVFKALSKEPARRYVSAAELAEDLRRFREGLPVEAHPPSASYRFGKFMRRHRVGAGFALAGALVLMAFGVSMALLLGVAERERDRANEQAAAAEQALGFLTGLFQVSDPRLAQGETMTARDALDAGAHKLEELSDESPAVRARLSATIGEVYLNLGLAESARPFLEEAYSLREKNLGPADPDTLHGLRMLGRLAKRDGKGEQAVELIASVLEGYRRVLGAEHRTSIGTASELGNLYQDLGRHEDARVIYEGVLQTARRVLGEHDETTRAVMVNLGVALKNLGRPDEAEPYYRGGLEVMRRTLGEDHPDTLVATNNLALLLMQQAKFDEAEGLFRDALERTRRVLGEQHPQTLTVLNDLATVLAEQQRLEESIALRREVLESCERVFDAGHPMILRAQNNLAADLVACGAYAEAEPLLVLVVEGARRVFGEHHPNTLVSVGSLAEVLSELDRGAEAGVLIRGAVDGARAALPEGHPVIGYTLSRYGGWLLGEGRLDEAEEALRDAETILARSVGEGHSQRVKLTERLAELDRIRGERWP